MTAASAAISLSITTRARSVSIGPGPRGSSNVTDRASVVEAARQRLKFAEMAYQFRVTLRLPQVRLYPSSTETTRVSARPSRAPAHW
jgi:hypothetical protein